MNGIHTATAIFLSKLLEDWHLTAMSIPYRSLTPSISQYKYYGGLSAEANSWVPAVRVACSDAQNVSSTDHLIHFPVLPDYGCWSSTATFQHPMLNQTPSQNVRTTWVPLPEEYGAASIGLIFEAPWTANEDSRIVLGCSVDARWTTGTVASRDPGDNYVPSSFFGNPTDLMSSDDHFSEFRPQNDSSWVRIELQPSWLDILTPQIQIDVPGQVWNATTLESIISSAELTSDLSSGALSQTEVWNEERPGGLNRTITLEWILSALLADGLSREGSARVFNTDGPLSSWTILDYNKTTDFSDQLLKGGIPLEKPNVTDLTVQRGAISITGYSYKASTFTDYLSISTLLIHILLAFAHIVELLIIRQSSSCWDTVTELLVLMQNSRPAPNALKNTCAGIKELGTFGKVAIIRATKPDNGASLGQVPHVEVLYHGEQQESTEMQNLLEESRSLNISTLSAPDNSDALSVRSTSLAKGDHGTDHSYRGSFLDGDNPSMIESSLGFVQPNVLYG